MTVKELIEKLNTMPQVAIVEVGSVCGYENCGGEVECVTIKDDGTVEIFG